ncbi:MAG TPA: serine/threonine-protein kinase, partial [Gemmatales bacterium]|nr:serine/threonine-protein kinase [Gemmatales bacterium]
MPQQPSAPELLMLLGSLDLLNETQVRSLMSQGVSAAEELLSAAADRGWLTPYQRAQIEAGRISQLTLGPYRILEPIGAGGMGQVFKARHPLMNRVVAVKLIRPERIGHGEALARFRQEIQAAAQLAHPNIVRAYDANQDDGAYYLAMEWIDGIDVAKHLAQRQQLGVAEACDIIRQAALGLQHAHEAGLVHRDLKPANLLLARDGVVKILDFGLARLGTTDLASADLEEGSAEPAGRLTQAGVIMGTPDYMAPEQTFGLHAVDIRADLYSLGCTLYELLVGRPPFATAKRLGDKIQAHRLYPPDNRIESLRGDVPPGVIVIVQSLLAKQPEHRLASPALLAQALTPYAT